MSVTKRTLLAFGTSLGLVSIVRAQAPQGSNQTEDVLLDHEAIHFTPEGRRAKLKLSETGVSALKTYAHQANGHTMVYRHGGKNYVVEDQRMPDGNMLFDRRRDWTA